MAKENNYYDLMIVGYLPSGRPGDIRTFTVVCNSDASNFCYKRGIELAEELKQESPGYNWRYHGAGPSGSLDDEVDELLVHIMDMTPWYLK